MPENEIPERATERKVTPGTTQAQLTLHDADLSYLGLASGGRAKVVTYSDRIEIHPAGDQ